MSELSAKNVNERLFVVGLLRQWEEAVQQRDRSTMAKLLSQVELADQSEHIIDCALNISR